MPKLVPRILSLVVLCLMLVAAAARATDFYVSPNGDGDGSIGNPWSLAAALGQPWTFHPGDTIWLRGGTYSGHYSSWMNGSASSPIIVRSYPGEWAKIDGGNSNGAPILTVGGSYTWFWGFEIMSSYGNRTSSQSGPGPSDIRYGSAIDVDQNTDHPGLKFINLAIHDTREGIGWWKQATDSEAYGNLVYYNGWVGPDDAHGHGIYSQNHNGTKKAIDNLIFFQFGHGFHAYGSNTTQLDNFYLEGNSIFMNGDVTAHEQRNVLIGGAAPAHNPQLISNYFYFPYGQGSGSALKLGYGAPCINPVVEQNYVVNGFSFNCTGMTVENNDLYAGNSSFDAQFPDNAFMALKPSVPRVFVRPNKYEAGRANLTIYNWNGASTVGIDLSSVLTPGQGFEIRNAMDYFGAAVVSGTYSGGYVTIPMTGLSVAAPVGWGAPASPGPEFAVFVVLPASGSGSSAPPAGLAAPWLQSDVGSVGRAGGSSGSAGDFALSGSGDDIWGTSDSFHYTYQPLSGDGTIVARVEAMDDTDPWAKAGVMIRESLGSDSTHAMTVVTPGNGIAFQRRPSTGAYSLHTPGANVSAPFWVKLVRAGNTFSGYSSPDGVSWTFVGSDTVAMATNVLVGLAVTSHNNGAVSNASMDNVALSTGGAPMILRLGGERGTLTSPMAVFSDYGAFGGQYIATTVANSGSASWTFSAPSSGTYYVWGRVKAADHGHDSFFVSMDGGSEDVYDALGNSNGGSGWIWTVLNGRGSSGIALSVNPRTFPLSAGSHTLAFRGREIQTGLDRLIITNDASFVPTEAP